MNRRKFLGAAATASLTGLAGCMGVSMVPRSESSYTGYMVDNEYEKGLIFPNTKVKMKTNPRSSEVEEFYIQIPEDEELYEKAEKALRDQNRVTIRYKRGVIENPTDAFGNASIVTDMEVHDETLDESE